jgi:hypothetical protein
MALDITDIWRNVPPEEKLEMMARAQSRGILVAFIVILVASTMAVGFQMPWLLWSSLLISPFVFQFATGKSWRDNRPKVLLEYLAARAVTRRYAFAVSAKDLGLKLIFKAILEEEYSDNNAQDALDRAFNKEKTTEVWVTLFNDAVVIISERLGGARCELASPFNDKLMVEAINESKNEYGRGKTIILTLTDRTHVKRRFRVTSRYPAALLVFEKQLQQLLREAADHRARLLEEPPKKAAVEEDDDDFGSLTTF